MFLALLLAFFIKHIIVVFVIQTQAQLEHKAECCHISSVIFTLYHIVGTLVVLLVFVGFSASTIPIAILSGILCHYVDWAKANIVKSWVGADLIYSWWMLGIDQWIHCVMYVGIVCYYIN